MLGKFKRQMQNRVVLVTHEHAPCSIVRVSHAHYGHWRKVLQLPLKITVALGMTLCAAFGVSASTITVVAPQEDACKALKIGSKGTSSECLSGKSVQISATAEKGWAFAGWYTAYDEESGIFSDKAPLSQGADWRTAKASFTAGTSDETLYARFVTPAEDGLAFDFMVPFAEYLEDKIPITNVYDQIVDIESGSFPTMKVKGLPTGLSFDAKTMRLSGATATPGAYTVEVTAENVSGYTYGQWFTLKVDNVVTPHVEGSDSEFDFIVGEELEEAIFLDTFFSIDTTDAEVKKVALSGLPAGLKFAYDDDWDEYVISGKPTKAGVYTVWATVTFENGTVEKASMLLTVNELDAAEYNVDFSPLEERAAGDSMDEGAFLGTWNEFDGGITAVSGLPDGIELDVETEDGEKAYYLEGTFEQAGRYTCKVTVKVYDWDDVLVSKTISREIVVAANQGVYLSVEIQDADLFSDCKVTGSGVYAPGETAILTAKAGKGCAFAGWYDGAGVPLADPDLDYRISPYAYAITVDGEREIFAKFVDSDEDEIEFVDLESRECVLDPDAEEPFRETFTVESASYPTLKFQNLPSGVSCEADPDQADGYVLSYDPDSVRTAPKPGRYQVTATASNVSRQTDVVTFRITVVNVTSEYIRVEDDYGVLTPNVEMTPISLTNAVDFARGDTLKVEGLPAGLKYDATNREIYGTPTKPGEYTLTFTATIKLEGETLKETATSFITVKPFPELSVTVDAAAEAAGCTVKGAGNYKAGTKVSLKATAAKGWVFAGWEGLSSATGLTALNPSLSYTMTTDDLTEVSAHFVEISDDHLEVLDIADLDGDATSNTVVLVEGESVTTNLVELLIDTVSYPTVSLANLPKGLKFDAKTFLITGKPTLEGVFYVTVTVKNAGGYSFVRVLRFAVVESSDDPIPGDLELENGAAIDFAALEDLYTGDYIDDFAGVGFEVGTHPETEADVKSVSVTGLPSGLAYAAALDEESGSADVVIVGTPTKPGRFTVKVSVSYVGGGRATSLYAIIVNDGGSRWLDVESSDETAGTVTGSGVYASGATVKISAKAKTGCVFAGWYEDEGAVFENLAKMDGVDYRTASASFVFRPDMFINPDAPALIADFADKADDSAPVIEIDSFDEWTIDPAVDDGIAFTVDSLSLPKVTMTGLPKGVTFDAVRGTIAYDSSKAATVVPGYYTVTVKAVNQSNKSGTATLTVFVQNKTSDWIDGLNPEPDAYSLMVGVAVPEDLIVPEVTDSALSLTVAGLPSGLKLQKEKDNETGVTHYWVEGVPMKPGTNTVTFTALGKVDGEQVKEVATITLCVGVLPQWSQGTFNGVYREVSEAGDETNDVGTISLTVSAAGKVSGKILAGGKSHNLTAASLESFDLMSGIVSATANIVWSALDIESVTIDFTADTNGLGHAVAYGLGGCGAELVQNVWLRKDLESPVFATGANQPILTVDTLVCKFGAKGVVKLSGKIGGVTVSGSTQTLTDLSDLIAGANARIAVYCANQKFAGGATCAVYDVYLWDSDDDGKLDSVEEPPVANEE